MVAYCVRCWRELPPRAVVCPSCGADVEALSRERTYVDKLIAALEHPEPETPLRAAWLLGKLRATEALPALIRVVERTSDPYLAEAAVEALGQIGDGAARPVLERAARQGALRVRQAAERALGRLAHASSG
jgi:HEAT repeat protein